jgi:CubicO group peptidase (beta-lactamase class C family)
MTHLSGQPYPQFMRQYLFAPLGMVDTAFTPIDPARLVRQFGDEHTAEERAYRDLLAFPAFGLYSTADDLIAFGQAMLNMGKRGTVRVLSEGAVATMTRVHTQGIPVLEDGKPSPTYQGLGWGMRSPFGNVIGSEHGYGHAGYGGSWLWIDPQWDLVFVLLSNSHGAQPNVPIKALNAVYGALERS